MPRQQAGRLWQARTRRAAAAALLLAAMAVAASAGCIARRPVAADEMAQYWYLTENHQPQARLEPLRVGHRLLPARWTFREDKSLIWSTVSIVRAADKLRAGSTEPVAMSFSPAHAGMAADLIANARTALSGIREIARPDAQPTPGQWADIMADALVLIEKAVRTAAPESDRRDGGNQEPLGMSAEPMLRMLLAYLNDQSGGQLLEELDQADLDQLRQVLAQVTLRAGFTAVGKQQPAGLRAQVVQALAEARRPEDARPEVRGLLLERLKTAPPAPAAGKLTGTVRTVIHWAPTLLKVAESFVRQWDKMESLAVEFGRLDGQRVAALTARVKPDAEVRVTNLFFMQPAFVLRGGVQMVIQPAEASTDETVILFEPVEGGAAEVRFEGLGWGLVRLFAFPIADAALREVRVARAEQLGQEMLSVNLLMEARSDTKDPRRLLAFRDVRQDRLVRSAFAVETRTERKELSFSYVTPGGRYTYQRARTLTER
jgi:hypothetical protein